MLTVVFVCMRLVARADKIEPLFYLCTRYAVFGLRWMFHESACVQSQSSPVGWVNCSFHAFDAQQMLHIAVGFSVV